MALLRSIALALALLSPALGATVSARASRTPLALYRALSRPADWRTSAPQPFGYLETESYRPLSPVILGAVTTLYGQAQPHVSGRFLVGLAQVSLVVAKSATLARTHLSTLLNAVRVTATGRSGIYRWVSVATGRLSCPAGATRCYQPYLGMRIGLVGVTASLGQNVNRPNAFEWALLHRLFAYAVEQVDAAERK